MALTYTEHLHTARSALCAARAALTDEISGYPAPIAGCDAQFNHLLAERQRIANALVALDDAVFVPTPRSPTDTEIVESR